MRAPRRAILEAMAVQFDERPLASSRSREKRLGLITRTVLGTGLAKTEQGAGIILIIITVLAVAGAWFLLAGSNDQPAPPSAEQVRFP